MEGEKEGELEILESSLSSDIISLPPGNALENISPVTECSDSELEFCSANQEKEIPTLKDNGERINLVHSEETVSDTNLADKVKTTLQDNANMLTDKTILKDLLLPQNTGFVNDLFSGKEKYTMLSRSANVLNYNSEGRGGVASKDGMSYLSVSSTPKKGQSGLGNEKAKTVYSGFESDVSRPKHVQFMMPLSQRHQDGHQPVINKNSSSMSAVLGSRFQSYNTSFDYNNVSSLGTDAVFSSRLNEIRRHLDTGLRESEEETSSEYLPMSRLFIAQLNNQKQRTKDLEEELALNEATLAKTTRELEIVQNRLTRREEQLKEAASHLEKLQNDWQSSHRKLILSRDTYRNQNEKLKQMLEVLNAENEKYSYEVKELEEKCKNYSSLQVQAEGLKMQLATSVKQYNDIYDENKRIGGKLKEAEDKLNNYEKDCIPQLHQQLESLKGDIKHSCRLLDEISAIKAKQEDDFALLQERHRVLLEKFVDDEDSVKKVLEEKEMYVSELNKMKVESSALSDNLHKIYQSQVDTIVQNRTKELMAELKSVEAQLQTKFSKEAEDVSARHARELEEIHKRKMEEINSLRLKFEAKESRLNDKVIMLQKENTLLQKQRQAIVSAVTTIIPHSELNFTLMGQQPGQGNLKLQVNQDTDRMLNTAAASQKAVVGSRAPDVTAFKFQQTDDENIQFAVPPLITSTSFSSVTDANGEEAYPEGRVTVRERKPIMAKRPQRHKDKIRPKGKVSKNDGVVGNPSTGKRFYKALEILNSMDTQLSEGSSRHSDRVSSQQFLEEVDRTVEELVEEINSLSNVAPKYELPHHDTSNEQDSAHLALKRINEVSDMLTNYVRK